MKYYRLALQNHKSIDWYWTTTALTSLQAVFYTLRSYSSLAQERVRVFIADSKDELQSMLICENNHIPSGSVTAAQFLRERDIKVYEPECNITVHETPAKDNAVHIRHLSTFISSGLPPENDRTLQPVGESRMNRLDRKRLSMEMGPGGDRNGSYLFSLDFTIPQLLAWIHLRARVQAGELQP